MESLRQNLDYLIEKHPRLRVLIIRGCSQLPENICQLKNLISVCLAYNRLESLPASICELKRLQCLILYKNMLKSLPSSLKHLQDLRILDVEDNKFNNIDQDILAMPNLEKLLLNGNKLQNKNIIFNKKVRRSTDGVPYDIYSQQLR